VSELVVAGLELSLPAVGGDELVTKAADFFGSVVGGDRQEPVPDRLERLIPQPRPELVHLCQDHRRVTDPDPGTQHGRGQGDVADRPGCVSHRDQLGRAAGVEGGSPLDHPRCGARSVRVGDHAPAQGFGQDRDPGRLDLPGQVINLPEERPQLGVADREHRPSQADQRRGRSGYRAAPRLDGQCP
jgi:hypothetical protein